MAGGRFSSFVMLAEMRTGSNFLEANLNAMEGVSCHGEVFNPGFIGHKDKRDGFGLTLKARDADPEGFLARMKAETPGLAGFRYFSGHDPRVLDIVMRDAACAKIVLTRNPLESYVSRKIAEDTGQWRITNTKRHVTARPRFEAGEFERHLEDLQAWQLRILRRLQASGQTAFYVDYEDIQELEVINGLAAWLGAPPLKDLDQTTKKQNPEPLLQKVSNPREMEAALARIDRFDLNRTPNFEPRRAPAVPQYLASSGAALLFQPVKLAPEARVQGWLAGFGPILPAFDRKSLRAWRQANPGFLSFSVVRHPLPRAWAAFAEVMDSDRHVALRSYLAQVHQLKLPERMAGFGDPATAGAAFAVFLDFLRRNLSGQTGMKVQGGFASQTAILQGMADQQLTRVILREDRLQAGLAQLCVDLALSCPPLPAEEPAPGPWQLADVHAPALEAAAEAAYERDYQSFGYGRWRA